MSKSDGRASNGGAREGAGRPAVKATIRDGDGLMVSQVWPNSDYVDLGSGPVTIEAMGRSRVIKVLLKDGSEIRILLAK